MMVVRDFMYLDIERVRSFVAQLSGGLPSQRTTASQHQAGGQGQAKGGIPLLAEASGAIDYHYLRSQTETSSLHDQIFGELFDKLQSGGYLSDMSHAKESDWKPEFFCDGVFLVVHGLIKIVDYGATASTMPTLPNFIEVVERLATYSAPGVGPTASGNKSTLADVSVLEAEARKLALRQVKNQVKTLPLKPFADFVHQGYGDLVRVKVMPFPASPNKVFVGSADRNLFRYPPDRLISLYGSVIDAGWVSVLQVNAGASHEPGALVSKTGNDIEDSLEAIADFLAGLGTTMQGVKFPAVAVTPIAIYREIHGS